MRDNRSVGRQRDTLNYCSRLSSAAVAVSVMMPALAYANTAADLSQLSIEELGNIEVTSVSKQAQPLSAAAASIYVITNDDIRRLGATTVPEALRLAPNLQVARLDALSYAISARGFNSTEASNKLLVLIDGRSVYSTLHSGVFWDAQNVMMEDIDRIEVVGGPGGTLWGANAVNGVINIITRAPDDTQGALISGSYGNVDQTFNARYGGKLGEDVSYRGYFMGASMGHTRNPNGTNHIDGWERFQGGFKTDWHGERDKLTLQGDFYNGGLDVVASETSGQSASFNWTHDFSDSSPLQIFGFYDRTHRNQPGILLETVNVYNIELQHGFALGDRHRIVWGGGYRLTSDFYDVPAPFDIVNARTELSLGNVFIQDEVALGETVKLTAGIKLEHHTYTGFEYMPNVRLAWQPTSRALLWASASRAVRTPSRLDRELIALPILIPAPDFASETLIAYEAGYRGQFGDQFTLSVSGFYNDYDDLRTTSLLPSLTGVLAQLRNGMRGHTYGVEAWAQYSVNDWWRLSGGVTALHKDLKLKPGVVDASNMQAAGNDPEYQVTLRSLMTPMRDVDLDIGLRAVDDLMSPTANAYLEMDLRIGWRVTDNVELSVAGFNLLHDQHAEGGNLATRREVRRTVQASARWMF
jgi:iron complex outermembrane receptor protein